MQFSGTIGKIISWRSLSGLGTLWEFPDPPLGECPYLLDLNRSGLLGTDEHDSNQYLFSYNIMWSVKTNRISEQESPPVYPQEAYRRQHSQSSCISGGEGGGWEKMRGERVL